MHRRSRKPPDSAFQRRTSLIRSDENSLRQSVSTIQAFSALEGLDAHGPPPHHPLRFTGTAPLGGLERRSEWMPLGVQRDELIGSERMQTVGVTGSIHKLDLEGVIGEHLDHSAKLACHQA